MRTVGRNMRRVGTRPMFTWVSKVRTTDSCIWWRTGRRNLSMFPRQASAHGFCHSGWCEIVEISVHCRVWRFGPFNPSWSWHVELPYVISELTRYSNREWHILGDMTGGTVALRRRLVEGMLSNGSGQSTNNPAGDIPCLSRVAPENDVSSSLGSLDATSF